MPQDEMAEGWHVMIPAMIQSVHIRGFRSLADVEIPGMPQAAVLIGANGSGKSNFIRFFEMLSWMLKSRQLSEFVARQGGADDQLFGGNNLTPRMDAEIAMITNSGRNDYRFALSFAHPDRFFFSEEAFRFNKSGLSTEAQWQYLDSGHREARIIEVAQSVEDHGVNRLTARTIVNLLRNCSIYQFHDTSDSSDFKSTWDVGENHQLRSHGGNLAAVLYRLEQQDLRRYELICAQIGRILPGFDRFTIEEDYGRVLLRWRAKWSRKTFGAHLTSDGSLRFFALVTLLNLPPEMLPDVILLDEPELGLHPAAISLVGGMIKSLAAERQVIVATQSPLLVDAFDIEEIFVLDLKEGRTQCRKLDSDSYRRWLENGYSPGDLWRKNLLGGRP
jgi:predicted ATPase